MLSTLYSLNTFSPFLLINSNSAVLCLVAQSYSTLCDPMDCSPPGSSVHEDSPGNNTGVGCHALLQGVFPTQGLNEPRAPQCRQILYRRSHQGSPRGITARSCFKLVLKVGEFQHLTFPTG